MCFEQKRLFRAVWCLAVLLSMPSPVLPPESLRLITGQLIGLLSFLGSSIWESKGPCTSMSEAGFTTNALILRGQ